MYDYDGWQFCVRSELDENSAHYWLYYNIMFSKFILFFNHLPQFNGRVRCYYKVMMIFKTTWAFSAFFWYYNFGLTYGWAVILGRKACPKLVNISSWEMYLLLGPYLGAPSAVLPCAVEFYPTALLKYTYLCAMALLKKCYIVPRPAYVKNVRIHLSYIQRKFQNNPTKIRQYDQNQKNNCRLSLVHTFSKIHQPDCLSRTF